MIQRINSWTQEEDKIIIENYNKISKKEIKNKFLSKRTLPAISKRIRILGQQNKIKILYTNYLLNHNFFNIPDIDNSYWAGFIASDGNVNNKNRLCLRLAYKDREILENFLKNLDSNHPIKDRINKSIDGIIHYASEIQLYSKNLCNKLNEHWNIIPRKSLILKSPKEYIKGDLALAFIKGYFDGDGCLIINKDGYLSLEFYGTESVLSWIKNILDNLSPVQRKETKVKSRRNIFRLVYCGTRAKKIHEILKNIPTIYSLNRKWNIKDFLEAQKERKSVRDNIKKQRENCVK